MTTGVQIDTTKLEAFARRLAAGLNAGGPRVARGLAEQTASAMRSGLPHRSGRLASSVAVADVPDGSEITYGTGVPYARYIMRRTTVVDDSIRDGIDQFVRAEIAFAEAEVRRA